MQPIKEEKIIVNEKALNLIKSYIAQRNLEDSRVRYTNSAITERVKKDLINVLIDIPEYLKEIEKWKQNRDPKHYYYDYELNLDLSIDPNDPESISRKIYEDRLYYYRAFHYLKLGVFKKEDAPPFKIKVEHLAPDIIYELNDLDFEDRKFVLKQAVVRIFEDINFDLYHDSLISKSLEVELIN
jgi:hypothetical protein